MLHTLLSALPSLQLLQFSRHLQFRLWLLHLLALSSATSTCATSIQQNPIHQNQKIQKKIKLLTIFETLFKGSRNIVPIPTSPDHGYATGNFQAVLFVVHITSSSSNIV